MRDSNEQSLAYVYGHADKRDAASIGLTIPAVAVVSIVLGQQLDLGLDAKEIVLLALTLLAGVITLGTGRTTVLRGIVHLVIFAAFLFLSIVP